MVVRTVFPGKRKRKRVLFVFKLPVHLLVGESSGVSYATATQMLRRRLGKGHEKVGINMSTMCYSVGKKLLNNLSAMVMKSGKKIDIQVYCQNHYFQLKKVL